MCLLFTSPKTLSQAKKKKNVKYSYFRINPSCIYPMSPPSSIEPRQETFSSIGSYIKQSRSLHGNHKNTI